MFNVPIPGESLTREPKNAPYERPPELNDPEDALIYHTDRLTNERRIKAAMLLLEEGIDIKTLTEGLLRKGVLDGIHSVDVSLIIAPAVHEYIKTTADMAGVEYKEGFEQDDTELDYEINKSRAKKALSKIKAEPKKPVEEEPMMDLEVEEPVMVEEEMSPKPRGLMARRNT